jgi:ABC-2 type transport system ATP-binding protein
VARWLVVVAESLTKRFGKITAVEDLSFRSSRARSLVFGTERRQDDHPPMLLGLARPTTGRALVFDRPYAAR